MRKLLFVLAWLTIALFTGCSKNNDSTPYLKKEGIYYIVTTSEDLDIFNTIRDNDPTARCSIYYPEKESFEINDLPYDMKSIGTIDFPKYTYIPSGTFEGCIELRTINLPECLTIQRSAFRECIKLTDITLPKCTSIQDFAFFGSGIHTTIGLPACTSIGSSAFRECMTLSSVDLPECTSIRSSAFSYCDRLHTINLPKCTYLANNLFSGSKDLENLSLLSLEPIEGTSETFEGIESSQVTLTLNIKGVEKNNIKDGNKWKDVVWKNIILK